MKICVVGMGFVGLTLAVAAAGKGHDVIGIETKKEVLASLRDRTAHFFEKGLQEQLSDVYESGKLKVAETVSLAADCDLYLITVGTPLDLTKKPNFTAIKLAAEQIAQVMKDGAIVILRSTVELGTSRNIVSPILDASGKKYSLAYCPERTIEGDALNELSVLPQICSGIDGISLGKAINFFETITNTIVPVSSLEVAELVKLLDNSYRDYSFAFANEVAEICDAVSVDCNEVIATANYKYSRTNIPKPGLVGGPCLEKDPYILLESCKKHNYIPKLIHSARILNEEVIERALENFFRTVKIDNSKSITITVCGMAFKGRPETDDLRGSPAKIIINYLNRKFNSFSVRVQDFACENHLLTREYQIPAVDMGAALIDSDIIIIANNHPNYAYISDLMRREVSSRLKYIYDFWSIVKSEDIAENHNLSLVQFGNGRI